MSTANLDAADLAAAAYGGLIREDVMEKIWDISKVPLPLTDRIGSGTVTNARFSWTQDKLGAPSIDGQIIDGADTTGSNDTATGTRVQNFCEIRAKVVQVSSRARESNTIGFSDSLAYQLMQRQRELRQDVEATALSNNGSVADDGATTPGQTGGLDAWLTTNTDNGATTGADGGFSTSTGLVAPYTAGTKRALNEAKFKDLLQAVYMQGGESTVVMARPPVVRKFSEYQFTSGARVATMTRNVDQMAPGSSLGAVNVYIGDFCTVEIIANRLQQETAAGVSTLFILDPSLLELAYLRGYVTEELAKTGTADKRQVRVDWGLRVGNEAGLAAFRDIDETLDMVAGP